MPHALRILAAMWPQPISKDILTSRVRLDITANPRTPLCTGAMLLALSRLFNGGGFILSWAGLEPASIQCGRQGCYKGGRWSNSLASRRQILDFSRYSYQFPPGWGM